MIHARKCEPEYFQAVIDGRKPFEIRTIEPDTAYNAGDFLALNEWSITGYTGRCCLVEITYVLDSERFVRAGTAVLGIRPCIIGRSTQRAGMFEDTYSVPAYGEVESHD